MEKRGTIGRTERGWRGLKRCIVWVGRASTGEIGFNLLPIVDVASRWVFAAKVAGASLLINLAGVVLYWNGTRAQRISQEATS